MRRLGFPAVVVLSVIAAMSVRGAAAPIRVMLLDGESCGPYHRWQIITPVLERELAETGLFQVDVVTAPPASGDFSRFNPPFAGYRAVIFNYDAPDARWPDALKTSFERYMANGGGLVTVHAADNAFPGWQAFNDMIGVGGWRGRNEQTGPLWYYKDEKLTSDSSPGSAGSHGLRTPYLIVARNSDHPIMRGLPKRWMHEGDELYAPAARSWTARRRTKIGAARSRLARSVGSLRPKPYPVACASTLTQDELLSAHRSCCAAFPCSAVSRVLLPRPHKPVEPWRFEGANSRSWSTDRQPATH